MGILKDFRAPKLATTTVEFTVGIRDVLRWIGHEDDSLALCLDLDRTLLAVAHRRQMLFAGKPASSRRKELWYKELGRYFPALAGQGLLVVATKSGQSD